MNRLTISTLMVGLLGLPGLMGYAADEEEPRIPLETRNFMAAKLKHSQKIVEGLAMEDFDLIARHGQEMSLLSLESQWNVLRTKRYVDESADFRHAIQRLVDAANAKKIEAAALGYVDVTLKCIHCHMYVRDKGAKEAVGTVPAVGGPLVQHDVPSRRGTTLIRPPAAFAPSGRR